MPVLPAHSQQNGKAERVIRSINNMLRTLLIQAGLPLPYWVEALQTATHLFNLHPTKTLHYSTPHQALFGSPPSYSQLRVFGCRCYPNLSATTPHNLTPRSSDCIFLGYPKDHKGYRCLDLTTNKVITFRHVVFDELTFPYTTRSCHPISLYSFLDDFADKHVPPAPVMYQPGIAPTSAHDQASTTGVAPARATLCQRPLQRPHLLRRLLRRPARRPRLPMLPRTALHLRQQAPHRRLHQAPRWSLTPMP